MRRDGSGRWGVMLAVTALVLGLRVPGGDAAELSGEIGVEGRWFPSAPLEPVQADAWVSVRLEPEFYHDWEDGKQRLALTAFGRWDSADDERTHADLRELYWRRTFGSDFDLYVGIRKVFWGVTETVHLVDIINQTDLVENIDGEDKLGQPMVAGTWVQNWGTIDLVAMPLFRPRTFPGIHGRPRTPIIYDTDNPVYESPAEETHFDWAARWSHYFGDFDIGIAHFAGTSRDPRPIIEERDDGPVLIPVYNQLHQTSLDLQYTRGDWLWKLEAVGRELIDQRSTAAVGGFEYTLVGVFESAVDLGLIAEYQYDDRREFITPNDNDVAFGGRLTFNDVNDTNLLAFAAIDVENGSTFASVEGRRRVGTSWAAEVEARLFLNTAEDDILYFLRKDHYVQLEVTRFF